MKISAWAASLAAIMVGACGGESPVTSRPPITEDGGGGSAGSEDGGSTSSDVSSTSEVSSSTQASTSEASSSSSSIDSTTGSGGSGGSGGSLESGGFGGGSTATSGQSYSNSATAGGGEQGGGTTSSGEGGSGSTTTATSSTSDTSTSTGVAPVCAPKSKKCEGSKVETCSEDGSGWGITSECSFLCSEGECVGECKPGDTECSGVGVQTCGPNAVWGPTTACPTLANSTPSCSGKGICGSSCLDGFEDCDGKHETGCEADLSSPDSCGDCNNSCPDATNASGACGDAGSCGLACDVTWGNCDDDPLNGCEHDVWTDPENCGACGKSCFGGTCSNGTCSQQNVEEVFAQADKNNSIARLALSSTDVFFAHWGPNSTFLVSRTPKAGGAATQLASTEATTDAAVDLEVDATNVYWASGDRNTVKSVPVNGGTTKTLISQEVWQIATDGTFLYYTTGNKDPYCPDPNSLLPKTSTSTLWKIPVGGGAPTKLRDFTNPTGALLVRGGKLYLMNCGLWNNQMKGYYSGKVEVLDLAASTWAYGSEADNTTFMAVNDTYIFLNQHGSIYEGITRKPMSQDVSPTMILPSVSTQDLEVDGANVYLTDHQAEIRRASVNGGTPTAIAKGQSLFGNLVIDDTHVYWITLGFRYGAKEIAYPAIMRSVK